MEDSPKCIIRTGFYLNHGMHKSESTTRRTTFGAGMPIQGQQKTPICWNKEE
jgi:hypothetical protein